MKESGQVDRSQGCCEIIEDLFLTMEEQRSLQNLVIRDFIRDLSIQTREVLKFHLRNQIFFTNHQNQIKPVKMFLTKLI